MKGWFSFPACDDARIRIWDIPEGGLKETITEPSFSLIGQCSLIPRCCRCLGTRLWSVLCALHDCTCIYLNILYTCTLYMYSICTVYTSNKTVYTVCVHCTALPKVLYMYFWWVIFTFIFTHCTYSTCKHLWLSCEQKNVLIIFVGTKSVSYTHLTLPTKRIV